MNNIKLINDDCMNVMKDYENNYFDLAIVDPPYGGNDAINLKDNKKKGKQATKRTDYKIFENVSPSVSYFDELKRVSKEQIIWGVNFYKNYDLSGGRLCWDKKGTAFGRAELCYLSMTNSVNVCEITWNGMIQQDMKNKEHRIHPTQKPVKLYEWLLENYSKKEDRILDTHLGSGSSAIASYYFGVKEFVGIELDKEYFETMNKRFKEQTKQIKLF